MSERRQRPEVLIVRQRLGGYAWEVRQHGNILGRSHQQFSRVETAVKSLQRLAKALGTPLSYRVVDPYAKETP